MSKGWSADDHPNVARCPRIAAIDTAIEEAAEVQSECRNVRDIVVGEIRSVQQSVGAVRKPVGLTALAAHRSRPTAAKHQGQRSELASVRR